MRKPWSLLGGATKKKVFQLPLPENIFGQNFAGRQVDTGWTRGNFEYQLNYLMPWFINTFTLFTMATTDLFKLPGTELSVPVLPLMSIPLAMSLNRMYIRNLVDDFKKKADADPQLMQKAADLEAQAQVVETIWRRSFGRDIRDLPDIARNAAVTIKDILNTDVRELGDRCVGAFLRK